MRQYIIVTMLLIISNRLPAQQNDLPAMRPADFKLSFHYDGGMSYYFEDLAITKDSCIRTLNEKGKIIVTRFKLSDAELDSLYALLKQNRFTQIEYSTGGMVYDRGGERMTISWNNDQQRYAVNDSQSSFVANHWKGKWGIICDYVRKLHGKKISMHTMHARHSQLSGF